MEDKKIIEACNHYKKLLEGRSKKYSLADIKVIYDVLKSFIINNRAVYITFMDNVAAFFENHGFSVAMDDDKINYMIMKY